MLWAVAGPMPSSSSSCSSVAVLRLSGAPGGVSAGTPRGGRADPLRDEYLAAVLDLGRQVDLAQVGTRGGASGPADGIVDPGTRAHPVDARPADGAGDVDDDRAAPSRRPPGSAGGRRPRPALAATPARELPRAEQRDGDDGERTGREATRGEIGHGTKLWMGVLQISTQT